MVLIEDVGQKLGKHVIKNKYFVDAGIRVIRGPLPVGDYCILNQKALDVIKRKQYRGIPVKKMDFLGCFTRSVDTKESITELYSNLVQGHARFRDECVLAQNNNIKLTILVENVHGIGSIPDILNWNNPQFGIWKVQLRRLFIQEVNKHYNLETGLLYLININGSIPELINYTRFDVWQQLVQKEYLKHMKVTKKEDMQEYLKKYKIKYKKKPVDNNTLMLAMFKMQEKYGVEFLFCKMEESGLKVLEILQKSNDK
jgi:hypothetical protein